MKRASANSLNKSQGLSHFCKTSTLVFPDKLGKDNASLEGPGLIPSFPYPKQLLSSALVGKRGWRLAVAMWLGVVPAMGRTQLAAL